MKKKSKTPRKFDRRKVRQKVMVRQESWNRQPNRMSEGAIAFTEELSPDLETWYRISYDESGRYVEERIKCIFG